MELNDKQKDILAILSKYKGIKIKDLSLKLKLNPTTLANAIIDGNKSFDYNGDGWMANFRRLVYEGKVNTWQPRHKWYCGLPETKKAVVMEAEEPQANNRVEKALDQFLKVIAEEAEKGMADKFKEKNDKIKELEGQLAAMTKSMNEKREPGIVSKYFPYFKNV